MLSGVAEGGEPGRSQRPIAARFTSAQTQESSGWQNPGKQHFINPFPTT